MNTAVEERVIALSHYILENKATVRAAAVRFHVSKSTVHKDVSERLQRIDPPLYRRVRVILDLNKQERHIRGGLATREKYRKVCETGHTAQK
ncbi:MAG: sporulation transcriptional regulator SpoIIID [Clostridia bacterium]|nr:sporulation transcriptional regulator SpoIIID [Clostridia bacterium]